MKSRWLMTVLSLPLALVLLVGLAPGPVFAGVLSDTEVEITEGAVTATYLAEDGTGWIKVNGLGVVITADTEVNTDDGDLVVGAVVDVEGTLQMGDMGKAKVMAEEIRVEVLGEGDEAEGGIEIRDGTITKVGEVHGMTFIKVNGLAVAILPGTEVDGDLVEGAEVDVEGTLFMGKVLADEVKAVAAEEEESE